MAFVLRLLAMLALAVGIGFGLSYYALTDGRLLGAVRAGPWAAWPDVGQPNPDPYTRAYLSRSGILQLGYSEGIRFVAEADSAGNPLRRRCQYLVSGPIPGAAFWTLVAVTPDGVNVAASPQLIEMRSDRIAREENGEAEIHIGPRLAPGNWLEIAGAGPFEVVLTLYDAAVLSGASSSMAAMPTITRGECQ